MKTCMGCKYAEWEKTRAGKLHPSGQGFCKFEYKIPQLPRSMYWINNPRTSGGSISRKCEMENHCVYYQRN